MTTEPIPGAPAPTFTALERRLLFLISVVQIVNIVDFMMVMPLGPEFSEELGIPSNHLGIIGGSYTLSASITGILGTTFLDRFDRRSALAVALVGLAAGTLAGGLSWDLPSLVAARVLAGAFGGPATALALSIVADAISPERRGRAMGIVMGAFSIASILGVPAGLKMAELGGWRAPFFILGLAGLAATAGAIAGMPPMRDHLSKDRVQVPLMEIAGRRTVQVSLLIAGMVTMGNFSIIPNISAYLQYNANYPRADLDVLYMAGGATSFIILRLVGGLVDRVGPVWTLSVGSAGLVAVILTGFAFGAPLMPPILLFVGFMGFQSIRQISFQTLSSLVPAPSERARYQSAHSASQHLFSAVGAMIGATILVEGPGKTLIGMGTLSVFACAMAVAIIPAVAWLYGQVKDGGS